MELEHPPETVVKTSLAVVLAGFCLICGLLLLCLFLWASRGGSKPDAFNKRITIQQVSEKYKSGWTPGKFWPSVKNHSEKNDGSPLPKVVWSFLIAWLFASGVYLMLAGAISSIENFREHQHLQSAALVAASLCLCGLWTLFFRIGSHHDAPPQATYNKTKGAFLWISWSVLFVAAILATLACATLKAWTLPGPQFGTLLFVAPGYGLLAGWIWFASALNCSIAISHASYPAGTVAQPDGDTRYTHRASVWPIFIALLLVLIANAATDPAIPIPTFVALFFFTPKRATHIVASLICLAGSALPLLTILE